MRAKRLLVALGLLAATVPAVGADSEDIIKYRESVMKAYAGHTGAAARIVRGKVDEYAGQLLMHATAMRDISRVIGELFPPDSDFGDTHARDEVWSKRGEFEEAVRKNEQAAEAFFRSVSEGGDSLAAFKDLTDTCKGCHDKFRSEEE